MSSKTKKRPYAPIIEALESRILFSADPLGLAIDSGEFALVDENIPATESVDWGKPLTTQIILVDDRVKDHQTLTEQLRGLVADQSITTITISSNQSVADISEILSTYSDLSSIHVITHGSDNSVRIGSSVISSVTIDALHQDISRWGDALTHSGDILFYGCNLAESDSGKQLIDRIASITGADVAASTNLTGHHQFGADWELEYAIGDVLADSEMFADQLESWESILADTINVDTTDDIVSNTDSLTSLREAITMANNTAGADVIELPTGHYRLNGELSITDDVTISGTTGSSSDTIIDAEQNDRVFNISNSAALIENLTIQNGQLSEDGGGMLAMNADVSLRNVTVDNNQTPTRGGGIYAHSDSTLTIEDSILTNNAANIDGGAIYSTGTLSINRTELTGNTANNGGAIFSSGDLSLVDTWLHLNSADNSGGAIQNAGNATIARSLLEHNEAVQQGGGITNNGGNLIIENTTLTHNEAGDNREDYRSADVLGEGGAVANVAGTTDINQSTIVYNKSYMNSAMNLTDGAINIQGNIIYYNDTGLDVVSGPTFDQYDIDWSVTSLGFNLIEPVTNNPHPTDLRFPGVDAGLATDLSHAGGFTKVFELTENSVAINKGPVNLNQTVDSTGAIRNTITDIGAFEYRKPDTLGTIYVAEPEYNRIVRFTTEVEERQTIVTTTDTVTDLEVDEAHNRIYWLESDDTSGSLFSAYLDGTDVTTLASDLSNPTGLAVDTTQTPPRVFVTRDASGPSALNGIDIYDGFTGDPLGRVIEGSQNGLGDTRMKTPVDVDYHAATDTIYWTEQENPVRGVHSTVVGDGLYIDNHITQIDDPNTKPNGLAVYPDGSAVLIGSADRTYEGNNNDAGGSAVIRSSFGAYRLDYFEPTNSAWATDSSGNLLLEFSLDENNDVDDSTLQTPSSAIAVAQMGPVTGPPEVILNQELSLTSGRSSVIYATQHLNTTDPDPQDTGDQIVYTLKSLPQEGVLKISAEDGTRTDLTVAATFTQSDIDAGYLSYTHTGTTSPDNDHFAFNVNDGTYTTPDSTFFISIKPPVAPLISSTNSPFEFSYTEGDGPVSGLASTLNITDNDDATLATAKITIAGYQQGYEIMRFSNTPTINGVWDDSTGELTLSGTDEIPNYLSAINSIEYENTSDNIDTNTHHAISFTVSDGTIESNTLELIINTTTVNDPPVFIDLNNSTSTYVENGPTAILDSDATIYDPELSDVDNFEGTTLVLQRNGVSSDDDNFQASDNGVIGALIEGSELIAHGQNIGLVTRNTDGILELLFNNQASNSLINSVIQNIAYSNDNDVPPATVEISWIFSDNNNNAGQGTGGVLTTTGESSRINITTSNDPPAFGLLDNTPLFIEGGNAVILDNDVTITDPELAAGNSFSGTSLTLQRSAGPDGEDVFRIDARGNLLTFTSDGTAIATDGNSRALEEGGELHVSGSDIARITRNSSGTLTLTFTNSANFALINEAMQGIVYSNSSQSPPDNVHLSWLFNDNNTGNSQGDGGAKTATGSLLVTTVNVNDPPIISGLDGKSISAFNNGTPYILAGLNSIITDRDMPANLDGGTLEVTTTGFNSGDQLLVNTNGTVSLSAAQDGNPEVTVNGKLIGQLLNTATDTFSITFNSNAATEDISTLIQSLEYSSTNTNGGPRSVELTLTDGDGTANAGQDTSTANIAIYLTNTGSIPTRISVVEDIAGAVDLSQSAITDIGSPSTDLTLTLTTTNGGSLTAIGNSTILISGNDTSLLTLTGATTDLNDYLNHASNIQFRGALNVSGAGADTINVQLTDSDNTGTGGVSQIDLGSIFVDITAVNDDPVNTGTLPTNISVTEDISGDLDLSEIHLSDSDAESADLSLTLTTTTGGTLTAASNATVDVTDSDTNAITLTGSQTDLNDFLNQASNIQYRGALNVSGAGADTISVQVTDSGNTGTGGGGQIDLGSISVDISAINDDPVNTGTLPTNISVTEDIPGDLDLSAMQLSDSDAGNADLSLTLTTTTGGTLTAASNATVDVTDSDTNAITLTGSQTDLNDFLDQASNIQYRGALNVSGAGADTISLQLSDSGNTGTGGGSQIELGSILVDITAVNDPPVNTGTIPANVTVTEDTNSYLDLSLIDLTDVDSLTATLTLSASRGELSAPSTTNVTATASGSGTLSVSGNIDKLNDYLNNPALIFYSPHANVDGINVDVINITVRENGNSGSNDNSTVSLGSISIDISPVDDSPQLFANTSGENLLYNENDGSVRISDQLTLTDIDTSQLSGATITITGNYLQDQDHLTFNGTSLINSTWDAVTGKLTLTGTDSVAAYEAALRAVSYENTSDRPGSAPRTITFNLSDGTTTVSSEKIIQIINANDAPDVEPATIEDINEDNPAPQSHRIVDIFSNLFSDVDQDTFSGIAVTANNTSAATAGVWQYSTNNTEWYPIGTSSAANALLLGSQSSVRFVPVENYNGTPEPLLLRAIDSHWSGAYTVGPAQTFIDARINGGTTSLSAAEVSLSTTVAPVNDAPVIAANASMQTIPEDSRNPSGNTVENIYANLVSDVDNNSVFAGIAITTADNNNGTWQYSFDRESWQPVNQVSQQSAIILSSSAHLRFVPATDYYGTPSPLIAHAIDDSYTGTYSTAAAAAYFNLDSTGGTTPFSDRNQLVITVSAVNDSPVSYNGILPDIAEDTIQNTGTSIDQLFSAGFSDVDSNLAGFAVTGNPLSINGTWQYTANNEDWRDIGAVNPQQALLLNQFSALRFQPSIDYHGEPQTLGGHIADDSNNLMTFTSSDPVYIDTTSDTAFSQTQNTVSVSVLPVNDEPAGTDKSIVWPEDTPYIFSAGDFGFTDAVDGHEFERIKVHSLPSAGSLTLDGTAVAVNQRIDVPAIEQGLLQYAAAPNATGSHYTNWQFNVVDSGGSENNGIDTDQSANTITFDILAINDPPLGSNNTVIVKEDHTLVFTTGDFQYTDPVEGHSFKEVHIVSLPEHGMLSVNNSPVVAGQSIPAGDIAAGLLHFDPTTNANGIPHTDFHFSVVDNGGTDLNGIDKSIQTYTMTINVLPVNDAPTGSDNSIYAYENDAYQFKVADFGFTDNIDNHAFKAITIDPPGKGRIEFNNAIVSSPTSVSTTQIEAGALTFHPLPTTHGANYTQVSFTVTDNGGTTNGGSDASAPPGNTLTFDVLAVTPNAVNNTVSTNENENYIFHAIDFGFSSQANINAFNSVLITAIPSATTGSLQYDESHVEAGTRIPVLDIAEQQLAFVPAPTINDSTTSSLGFRLLESDGGANGGTTLASNLATLTINITAVNDQPQTSDAVVKAYEDQPYALTRDSFAFDDADPDDTLSAVILESITGQGVLTLDDQAITGRQAVDARLIDAGELVFHPSTNSYGDNHTQVTFRVKDSAAEDKLNTSDPATLTFNVTAINDAPTGLEFSAGTIKENIENEVAGTIQVVDVDDNTHTLLVDDNRFIITDGNLTLKPGITLDFETEPQIPLLITAIDNNGDHYTQQIILTIQNVNEPPVSKPRVDEAVGTTPFSFAVPDGIFIDADNDQLSYTATLANKDPLPQWLLFDPVTQQFTINDPGSFISSIEVMVTATDPGGLYATTIIEIFLQPGFEPALPAITPSETTAAATPENSEELPQETKQETTPKEKLPDTVLEQKRRQNNPESNSPPAPEIPDISYTEMEIELPNEFTRKTLTTQSSEPVFTNVQNDIVVRQQKEQLIAEVTMSRLSKQMDNNKSDLSNETDQDYQVIGTSTTMASGLSVGYILWLLRSGALMASVLSSLPAWRVIDPLPVLGSMDDGDDSNDTETLESMVQDNDARSDPDDKLENEEKAAQNGPQIR